MLDLFTNLPCEDTPTKSEATNPATVEKSWLGIEASHFSSISLTSIFFPLGATAGFAAAVEVVASFFSAVAVAAFEEVAASAFFSAAGAVASVDLEAGVSSTVADAFSSVVGGVDSGGEAESS